MSETARNYDEATVRSFGRQWSRFDQSKVPDEILRRMFADYFAIFPWERLPPMARGADLGCGSGRWARLAAARVAELHCVDASEDALAAARRNLRGLTNVAFHRARIDALPFADGSLDFAYSLGVLHHLPDTGAALRACTRKLKAGAPFLVYLYYAFDNRPWWYRLLWRFSDGARRIVSRIPPAAQSVLCDLAAAAVYWPFARLARLLESAGVRVSSLPLSLYRDRDFHSMRTDARDRFGTPLERRFRAEEIRRMMEEAGLSRIRFSDLPPFWCAVGFKTAEAQP
jgi:SAM-dependent methyltransferase